MKCPICKNHLKLEELLPSETKEGFFFFNCPFCNSPIYFYITQERRKDKILTKYHKFIGIKAKSKNMSVYKKALQSLVGTSFGLDMDEDRLNLIVPERLFKHLVKIIQSEDSEKKRDVEWLLKKLGDVDENALKEIIEKYKKYNKEEEQS